MPVMLTKKAAGEDKDDERKIDLSEIIGLPDFDVRRRSKTTPSSRLIGINREYSQTGVITDGK